MSQAQAPYRTKKANKFGACQSTVLNTTFDSRAEAERYLLLVSRLQAGEISNLVIQPKYELQPAFRRNGKAERAITYTADFEYSETGQVITEEVKGFETEAWRIRRRMFLYQYPDNVLRMVRNGKVS